MRTTRVKSLTRVRGTRVFPSLWFALLARCDARQINVRKYINMNNFSGPRKSPTDAQRASTVARFRRACGARYFRKEEVHRAVGDSSRISRSRPEFSPGPRPPQNGSRGNDERNNGHGERELSYRAEVSGSRGECRPSPRPWLTLWRRNGDRGLHSPTRFADSWPRRVRRERPSEWAAAPRETSG